MYLLAIDQGTTQTKALVVDAQGGVRARAARKVELAYPQPGWVETSADSLWRSVVDAGREAVAAAGIKPTELAGIALSNQGETALAWDRLTGEVLGPVISWQCKRSSEMCKELDRAGLAELVRRRTGLPLDPYFSATKFLWLLQHVDDVARAHARGRLALGTTDVYLLGRLVRPSGAAPVPRGTHRTDAATASRTMLLNLRERTWDMEILQALDIPAETLPKVVPNTHEFGIAAAEWFGAPVPIVAACVDQQAALYGQRCYAPGECKVTYGTGAFILMNVGAEAPLHAMDHGVIPTIAWSLGDETTYALDGGIYSAGAAVAWLVDLGLIDTPEASEDVAALADSSGGALFVPSLSGLGAPFWDADARGAFFGLTRGTTKAQLVRAVLEGVALRVRDVIQAMHAVRAHPIQRLRADGGMSANRLFVQIQSDVLGMPVDVASDVDATALGVASMAGRHLGWWSKGPETPEGHLRGAVVPRTLPETLYSGWEDALRRVEGRVGGAS